MFRCLHAGEGINERGECGICPGREETGAPRVSPGQRAGICGFPGMMKNRAAQDGKGGSHG